MTYISIADVRRACGIPSSLMTDAQITSLIAEVEVEMERWLNAKFVPTPEIDVLDGTGTEIIFTKRNPLLSVRSLKANKSSTSSTTVTPAYLFVYKNSGKIALGGSAEAGTFIKDKQNQIIEYLHAWQERSATYTSLSTASTAGTSVVLTVADESSFADDDWVEIFGTDGNNEVAKITATDTGTITVDKLVLSHSADSYIYKLQIPTMVKRYMEVEAGIYCAINAIGATYTFNASYSIGELSVVKGVPYTHWQSSVEKLLKERDMRRKTLLPRMAITVM